MRVSASGDKGVVNHPAASLQVPPKLAVAICRTAGDVHRGVVREAGHDRSLQARLGPNVGAAGDVNHVVHRDPWEGTRGLGTADIDEVPAARMLVEIDPAAAAKSGAVEITGVGSDDRV